MYGSRACSRPRAGCHARQRACVGSVLRTEQGPVQGPRLRSDEDRALRHLLLPERQGGRESRCPDGRALACAAGKGAGARAARAPAARALWVASGFRADQRDPGSAQRRDGRRHRIIAPAHHPAVERSAGRHRSRHRPRARARVPVRHHGAARRPGGRNGRALSAAVVHRGYGRVSVHRRGRLEHGDVAARCGAR